MKASELRIGNWVSWHDDKSDQLQIDSVNESNARLVNPIPLTEEWLLKFGFDRPFAPPIYERVTTGMDKRFRVHKVTEDTFLLGNYESLSLPIKYVHQLQNLCFALTGEELTVKQLQPEQ